MSIALRLLMCAGTLAGLVADAGACSPGPWFSRQSNVLSPTDGLPTNLRIRVKVVQGCEPLDVRCVERVQTASGEVVPGAWEPVEDDTFEFVPVEPFAANAAYALSDRYGACDRPPCEPGPFSVWETFTTGSGRDDTPHPFEAPTNARCSRATCDDDGCCGPFDEWHLHYDATFPPSRYTPEGASTLFATVRSGTWGPWRMLAYDAHVRLLGPDRCPPVPPGTDLPLGEDVRVVYELQDLAGNVTRSPVTLVMRADGESCTAEFQTPTAEDAEPGVPTNRFTAPPACPPEPDEPDAGVAPFEAVDGGEATLVAPSCQCGSSPGSSPSLLLLVGLFMRRGRRCPR